MEIFFSALHPSDFERRKALCGAICDVLWQAGNQTRCCICLQQDTAFFDTDYRYRVDGITEKVHIVYSLFFIQSSGELCLEKNVAFQLQIRDNICYINYFFQNLNQQRLYVQSLEKFYHIDQKTRQKPSWHFGWVFCDNVP